MSNTEYYIKGKGAKVSLGTNNLKGSGGEGDVFVVNNTAYKIYTDPSKMIPLGKIQDLSVLTLPEIIKPVDVLLDRKNNPVGYTMTAVPDSYVLCQLFPKSFKSRNGITPDITLNLIRKIQVIMQHCHEKNVLVVDSNEMNYLISKTFDNAYIIDMDSVQTKNYKATALMESIRDRHSVPNQFNEGTDWFAFAVIAFQTMIGIHPFKGIHPSTSNMDALMKANISVFHKDVVYPASVLPFDIVPKVYLDWFKSVFEQGKRCSPPNDLVATVIVTPNVFRIVNSNSFNLDPIFDLSGDIIDHYNNATVTTSGIYIGNVRKSDWKSGAVIGMTPKNGNVISLRAYRGLLEAYNVSTQSDIVTNLVTTQVMSTDGRVYAKCGSTIVEMEYLESSVGTQIIPKVVANIMENSTQMFEGIATQKALGSTYLSLFPKKGVHYQIRVKELERHRIIDAKYMNHVAIIVAEKSGEYDKFVLRFDSVFANYDLRKVDNISSSYSINFTVLDNGTVLHINEKEEVELFKNQIGSQGVRQILDTAIGSDCRLFSYGIQAIVARGGKISKFSMKTP